MWFWSWYRSVHLISCATGDCKHVLQFERAKPAGKRSRGYVTLRYVACMCVCLAPASTPNLSLLDCFKIVVAFVSVVTDDSAGAEDCDASVLMYTDLYPTATG